MSATCPELFAMARRTCRIVVASSVLASALVGCGRNGAPTSSVDPSSSAQEVGGMTMMASFRYMADGFPSHSNGDGANDRVEYTDISEALGGPPGILAVRSGHLYVDPAMASSESSAIGGLADKESMDTTESDYFKVGIRNVLGYGPIHIERPTSSDEVEAYMGFAEVDEESNGWSFETIARDAADGSPTTRRLLRRVEEGEPVETLYDSDETPEPERLDDGNRSAGIIWLDRYEDGRWRIWRLGTVLASGDGLPPLSEVRSRVLLGGQRNLVSDRPEPGFWVPMTGWAAGTPGVNIVTFGPELPSTPDRPAALTPGT